MATPFNLTARLNIQGPFGLAPVINNLRTQLNSINANVNIGIDASTTARLNGLNTALAQTQQHLQQIASLSAAARSNLGNLGGAFTATGNAARNSARNTANTNAAVARTAQGAAEAATEMEEFGRVSGLAIRRFAGFTIATGVIFGFINAVREGISEAISFQRELIKVSQVSGISTAGLKGLTQEITNLATELGVASSELLVASRTLNQAGFSVREVEQGLAAIAKTDLAPTFDNITTTTEGSIAVIRQFNLEITELESVLSSINSVAGQFAVESGDIIAAIRRAGGVFSAATGDRADNKQSVREFIALFTSVRATTRETAESIATGLRTVFSRLQRGSTLEFLRGLGIELETVEGKFVGPFEAIRKLNEELSGLETTDLRFAQIVEELGGIRQVGKILPLITQFGEAEKALKAAEEGQDSLTKNVETAQQALQIQFTKTRETFLALAREIVETNSFTFLANSVLFAANSFASLLDSIKPVLPILGAVAAIKGIQSVFQFGAGFRRGVGSGGQPQPGAGGGRASAQNTSATQQNTGATRANTTSQAQQTAMQRAVTQASAANVAATRANTSAIALLTAGINRLTGVIYTSSLATIPRLTGRFGPGFNRGGRVSKINKGGSGRKSFAKGGRVRVIDDIDTIQSGLRGSIKTRAVAGRNNAQRSDINLTNVGRLDEAKKRRRGIPNYGAAFLRPSGIKQTFRGQAETKAVNATIRSELSKQTGRKVSKLPGGAFFTGDSLPFNLISASLAPPASEKIEGIIFKGVVNSIEEGGEILSRQIKAPKTAKIDAPFLKKFNIDNIVGNVFEGILGRIGTPFENSTGESLAANRTFDFPSGLGGAAKLFDRRFSAKIPIDAKSTFNNNNLKSIIKKVKDQEAAQRIREIKSGKFTKRTTDTAPTVQQKTAALPTFSASSVTTNQIGGKSVSSILTDVKNVGTDKTQRLRILDDISKDELNKLGPDQPFTRFLESKGKIQGTKVKPLRASPDAKEEFLKEIEKKQISQAPSGLAMGGFRDVGVDAIVTPGERIFSAKAVQQAGLSGLEHFNTTGDPSKLGRFTPNQVQTVPGVGNVDSVPTTLEPGSFVVRKDSSENLPRFFNKGGRVRARAGGQIGRVRAITGGPIGPATPPGPASPINIVPPQLRAEIARLLTSVKAQNRVLQGFTTSVAQGISVQDASNQATERATQRAREREQRVQGGTSRTTRFLNRFVSNDPNAPPRDPSRWGGNSRRAINRVRRGYGRASGAVSQRALPAIFASSIIAPAAASLVGDATAKQAGIGGGIGGAAAGAATGAILGPLGAVVGGIVGAIGGYNGAVKRKEEEIAKAKVDEALKGFSDSFKKFSIDKDVEKFQTAVDNASAALNDTLIPQVESPGFLTGIFNSISDLFPGGEARAQGREDAEVKRIQQGITDRGRGSKEIIDALVKDFSEKGSTSVLKLTEETARLWGSLDEGKAASAAAAQKAGNLEEAQNILAKAGRKAAQEVKELGDKKRRLAEITRSLSVNIDLLGVRLLELSRAADLVAASGSKYRNEIAAINSGFKSIQNIKVPDLAADIELISDKEFNKRLQTFDQFSGGSPIIDQLKSTLQDVRKIRVEGVNTLAEAAARSSGFTAEGTPAEFNKLIDAIGLNSKLTQGLFEKAVRTAINQRQAASTGEGLIEEDYRQIIEKALSSVSQDALKAGTSLVKAIESVTNELIKNSRAFTQKQLGAIKLQNQATDLLIQRQSKLRDLLDQTPATIDETLADRNARVSNRVRQGGIAPTFDPTILSARIIDLQRQRANLTERESAAAISADQPELERVERALNDNTIKGEALKEALTILATDVTALAQVENELVKLNQQREKGRNFLEGLASASLDPKSLAEFAKKAASAQVLVGGRGPINQEIFDNGREFLREFGAIFGKEKEVNQLLLARTTQILRARGFKNAGKLAQGFVGRQSKEEKLANRFQEISSAQLKAIEAQRAIVVSEGQRIQQLTTALFQEQRNTLAAFLDKIGKTFADVVRSSLSGEEAAPPVEAASGGLISGGPYVPNRDTIDAKLQPKEFVVKRSVVQKPGVLGHLTRLNNSGEIPHFQDGGVVGSSFAPTSTIGTINPSTGQMFRSVKHIEQLMVRAVTLLNDMSREETRDTRSLSLDAHTIETMAHEQARQSSIHLDSRHGGGGGGAVHSPLLFASGGAAHEAANQQEVHIHHDRVNIYNEDDEHHGVAHHAKRGGFISGGPYVPSRDTVPAMLQPGEFVVRRSVAQQPQVGAMLSHLNDGGFVDPPTMPYVSAARPNVSKGVRGFQEGGYVEYFQQYIRRFIDEEKEGITTVRPPLKPFRKPKPPGDIDRYLLLKPARNIARRPSENLFSPTGLFRNYTGLSSLSPFGGQDATEVIGSDIGSELSQPEKFLTQPNETRKFLSDDIFGGLFSPTGPFRNYTGLSSLLPFGGQDATEVIGSKPNQRAKTQPKSKTDFEKFQEEQRRLSASVAQRAFKQSLDPSITKPIKQTSEDDVLRAFGIDPSDPSGPPIGAGAFRIPPQLPRRIFSHGRTLQHEHDPVKFQQDETDRVNRELGIPTRQKPLSSTRSSDVEQPGIFATIKDNASRINQQAKRDQARIKKEREREREDFIRSSPNISQRRRPIPPIATTSPPTEFTAGVARREAEAQEARRAAEIELEFPAPPGLVLPGSQRPFFGLEPTIEDLLDKGKKLIGSLSPSVSEAYSKFVKKQQGQLATSGKSITERPIVLGRGTLPVGTTTPLGPVIPAEGIPAKRRPVQGPKTLQQVKSELLRKAQGKALIKKGEAVSKQRAKEDKASDSFFSTKAREAREKAAKSNNEVFKGSQLGEVFSSNGEYSIAPKGVIIDNGVAVITKSDNSVVRVPINKLHPISVESIERNQRIKEQKERGRQFQTEKARKEAQRQAQLQAEVKALEAGKEVEPPLAYIGSLGAFDSEIKEAAQNRRVREGKRAELQKRRSQALYEQRNLRLYGNIEGPPQRQKTPDFGTAFENAQIRTRGEKLALINEAKAREGDLSTDNINDLSTLIRDPGKRGKPIFSMGKLFNMMDFLPEYQGDTDEFIKDYRNGIVDRKLDLARKLAEQGFGPMVPFAQGGEVPAMVQPGEFVVNRASAQANLPLLHQLNNLPRFQNGGLVGNTIAASGPRQSPRPSHVRTGMDTGGFDNTVKSFMTAVDNFGTQSNPLVEAMNNLSNLSKVSNDLNSAMKGLQNVSEQLKDMSITFESAPIRVDVVINGVEAFNTMEGEFEKLVTSKIQDSLSSTFNLMSGQPNETFAGTV